jgi:hypothetical protein
MKISLTEDADWIYIRREVKGEVTKYRFHRDTGWVYQELAPDMCKCLDKVPRFITNRLPYHPGQKVVCRIRGEGIVTEVSIKQVKIHWIKDQQVWWTDVAKKVLKVHSYV